jgi:ABC-type Na+ efflux pump permease subunit
MISKIVAIARAEYLQAVRSKAFIFGVVLMPIMMGGSALVHILFADQADLRERSCAVVDPTGELWPVLTRAAEERNSEGIWEEEDGKRVQRRPRFRLERHEVQAGDAGPRPDVILSQRVRDDQLDAFLLIGPDILSVDAEVGERPLVYHTDEPTFTELPNWLESVINEVVRNKRFTAANLDMDVVARLDRHVSLSSFGLAHQRSDGSVEEAQEEMKGVTFGIPAAAMMLLFMLVMISAPQLMNQVLEEKMQRISEVLVSAVTPFELMLGKLLSSVMLSLTLALLHLGGILWATHHWGVSGFVPYSVYGWFLLLLVFALLMYGSLFSALGSACSELRDAQSMMMPAMILVLIPLFAWGIVIESPNGTLARVLTFFPTATPMVLILRVVTPPGPPTWEVIAAVALCVLTTLALVWASGKVFRIGVLSQGQTPTFRKLLGWVVAK